MSRFFHEKDLKDQSRGRSLWSRIRDTALMDVGVLVKGFDQASVEKLEDLLLEADFGAESTLRMLDVLTVEAKKGKIRTEEDFRALLRSQIKAVFGKVADRSGLIFAGAGPTVVMAVGVNGTGKTTTIAKLAHLLQSRGRKVILGAGDTFRAGAVEQLEKWARRLNCDLVKQSAGTDPAAVAYDAVSAARSRGADVLILDTAGRLHTRGGLMDELIKVKRVVGKNLEGAPHEVLLVLDSTLGQNSISQARTFHEKLTVTGLALAKFDGTSKAGCAVAITEQLELPIKLLGVGENLEDLELFDPDRYADKVLS